jgi:hypothetical protein
VTDRQRERFLWSVIEAHEVLSTVPDPAALAVKVLHLDDPAAAFDDARHAELVWLIAGAVSAGRDAYNPSALGAYHLELNGRISDDTLIRIPGSDARGRDWTRLRSRLPLDVALHVTSPDGTLTPDLDARASEFTPWNRDGVADLPRDLIPFYVLADGDHDHIDMPWPDGSSRPVPPDEIAELLAHDDWLSVRDHNVPVAMVLSGTGSGSRAMQKAVASRNGTARPVFSPSVSGAVHDDPVTGMSYTVLKVPTGQKLHWVRNRPGPPRPPAPIVGPRALPVRPARVDQAGPVRSLEFEGRSFALRSADRDAGGNGNGFGAALVSTLHRAGRLHSVPGPDALHRWVGERVTAADLPDPSLPPDAAETIQVTELTSAEYDLTQSQRTQAALMGDLLPLSALGPAQRFRLLTERAPAADPVIEVIAAVIAREEGLAIAMVGADGTVRRFGPVDGTALMLLLVEEEDRYLAAFDETLPVPATEPGEPIGAIPV